MRRPRKSWTRRIRSETWSSAWQPRARRPLEMSLIPPRIQGSNRDSRRPSDRAGRLLGNRSADRATLFLARRRRLGWQPSMALARILALGRVVCGLASAFTLAGIDPITFDTRRLLGGGGAIHGQRDRGDGKAGVGNYNLYFMLISLGNRSRSERDVGLQASPQPLYVGGV